MPLDPLQMAVFYRKIASHFPPKKVNCVQRDFDFVSTTIKSIKYISLCMLRVTTKQVEVAHTNTQPLLMYFCTMYVCMCV